MVSGGSDLDGAYALRTPEDNRRYYADWAARYDADFAGRMAYRTPRLVAQAFVAAGGIGPVLDVGAGTGLVGVALAAEGVAPVDGIDLSPEMLAVAATKGCYRHLVLADLTQPLPPLPGPYAGMTSAGTFTHGHLGPGVLGPLTAELAPGAVLAFTVHEAVWLAMDFPAALAALPLAQLATERVRIYDACPGGAAHADDHALIVTARRT
jgi:predicted TPR repeat methyltransferase